jgi:hypothetical protein
LSDLSTIQFRVTFKGHKSLEYCCLVMNFAPVSTISYGDSNDGILVLVGLLECIKPEIVGPESPRLINFPAKMKFRERARNFSGQLKNTAILQQGTGHN